MVERSVDGFAGTFDTRNYEYVTITIDESIIKLNGFNIIGRIDDVEGSIIVSGMSDMSKYRNVSMTRCDHCNTARKRNHLVLLSNKESEVVVGSTCLTDYTGHASALSYLSSISWIMNLQETLDAEGFCSVKAKSEVINIKSLLNLGVSVVRKFGYVSSTKAFETTKESTKSIVASTLFDRELSYGADWITESDKETAAKVIEWFETSKHQDSDYFHNVSIFMEKGYVPLRFIGYIVGLIPWFKKATEEKTENIQSIHIGAIGQKKVRLTIELVHSVFIGAYAYGAAPSYMHVFRSGSNMVRYNTTTEFEVGMIYEVEATIKDHTEYKGNAQTVITRAKILTSTKKV